MTDMIELLRDAHHVSICETDLPDCLLCSAYLIDRPEADANRTMELAQGMNNLTMLGFPYEHNDPQCPTCNALNAVGVMR